MKRLLFLITPLLIFTLLFSACSPTEKDNFESTLAYFQIDFIKSDFEMTESTSDKADYVRAYKVSVTEKERKKLIEHFKSFENEVKIGERIKIKLWLKLIAYGIIQCKIALTYRLVAAIILYQ